MNNSNTKIRIVVKSGESSFTFVAMAHQAFDKEDFFLDPILFYHTYGKKIPTGEHWELEILEPLQILSQHTLHTARSARSTNPFVCFPCSLPTLEKATALFQVWCVGAVLTILHKVDLNTVYEGDDERFFEEMKEEWGITIESCE